MSNPLIKSRLQIGNKLLGDIFYDKDSEGRGYLKLSLSNKIAGLVKWSDVPTLKPAVLKSEDPTKLEISYKFPDNLFAIKTLSNGQWKREFHEMPIPHSSCLFIIKIKNQNLLSDADGSGNPLVIDPLGGGPIDIIFSFPGERGVPIVPLDYPNLKMASIAIPETPLNKLWIGMASDPNNSEVTSFVLKFPFALSSDEG